MKKLILLALALVCLLFFSCRKDDERDAFAGTFYGNLSVKGTKVVDGGDPQPVTQTNTGYFNIVKEGNKGNKVTIKIVGFDYGSLTGSVEGNTLTVDPLHTTVEETTKIAEKTIEVDLTFAPATIADGHLTLNGALHTRTTTVSGSPSVTSVEVINSAVLIDADKL